MNPYIIRIQENIEPFRRKLIDHKIYKVIQDINDLQIFMEHHVFAVWDFMSLLKSLQNKLTCTTTPWFPSSLPEVSYLINEIVLGEETDVDINGSRKSHFEIYLDAMKQSGARITQFETFSYILRESGNIDFACRVAGVSPAVRDFIAYTFQCIESGSSHLQAAVFTFGREDLIPAVFTSIVRDISLVMPGKTSVLKYYLERHIEVDGGHHSILALQMVADLCKDNDIYWAEAEQAAVKALEKRVDLWDCIYDQIMRSK